MNEVEEYMRKSNRNPSQITQWCHTIIMSCAKRGGVYIDATMGKGHDTEFLCRLAGETGSVLAFDIQKEAILFTEERLKKQGILNRASLILDGHEHMEKYADEETVDVICFNFGYLPGGNHRIATKAATSLEAIEKGLKLLKPGGMMSLCIYSGGDTGFEEKKEILEYLKDISSEKYIVIVNAYYNRGNHPPLPVFIFKKS